MPQSKKGSEIKMNGFATIILCTNHDSERNQARPVLCLGSSVLSIVHILDLRNVAAAECDDEAVRLARAWQQVRRSGDSSKVGRSMAVRYNLNFLSHFGLKRHLLGCCRATGVRSLCLRWCCCTTGVHLWRGVAFILMAPRQASRHATSAAKGVKTKSFKGCDQRKPLKENANLLKVRAKMCDLCGQNTHDSERDVKKKSVKLKWVNLDFSVKCQAWVPSGRECYYCADTRKKFWTEDCATFTALMQSNTELEEKFLDRRRARVQGSAEFNKEQREPAKNYVKKARLVSLKPSSKEGARS